MADQQAALKALSQALKLERDGQAFYLKVAEGTLNEKAQAVFRSLAGDEKMHEHMVLRQLQALEGGSSYVLLPDMTAAAIDLRAQIFPPQRAQMDKKVGINPGELDALYVGLEAEIKSYDLYRGAAQETSDAAGKQMYQWLTSAELTHYNLLMSNYESLVSLGSWV